MFCLICRMHDAQNAINKSKVFNLEGSRRYKRSALVGQSGHIFANCHMQSLSAEVARQNEFV